MKKVFLWLTIMLATGYQSNAAETQKREGRQQMQDAPDIEGVPADSLAFIQLEEVIVSATRAGVKTPVSYTTISAADIKKQNAGRHIPAILQTTPSLVSFTEDGLGVGNTFFRIRGTDATRINVTLNGMPLNNP